MLHITDGNSTAGSLQSAGAMGRVATWAELLSEGPIRPKARPGLWRQTRARFYAECGWGSLRSNLKKLDDWDKALRRRSNEHEVVLWLGGELFGQLLLWRHLHYFATRKPPRLSLVMPGGDGYPEELSWNGLGALEPAVLLGLLPERRRLGAADVMFGGAAWHAFGASTPEHLACLAGRAPKNPTWRFFASAVRKIQEHYPWTSDGLNRVERQVLTLLDTHGPMTLGQLFSIRAKCLQGQSLDSVERPCLGDWQFALQIQRVARGDKPLVRLKVEKHELLYRSNVSLTRAGRAVLAGEADAVALLGGIDRWIGGVPLKGRESPWRWDDQTQRMVSCNGT